MSDPLVTVVVPTLHAGEALSACLDSLQAQTIGTAETIVIDNSGRGLARSVAGGRAGVRIIENQANVGFGAALNQGIDTSSTPFVASLNDDAIASPRWLESLLEAASSDPRAGLCASRVMLAGTGTLDSAGMLISADGSSKQRGHGLPAAAFDRIEEVIFASGSAALYRRAMIADAGGFDDRFFLYCEDTDLGLRARRAGWRCLYVPEALVEHRYSHSAGRASPLKAYLVERNRLFVLLKNFPCRMLIRAPWATLERYFWHAVSLGRGRGAAGRFHEDGHGAARLLLIVLRAHLALLPALPRLFRQRREIRRKSRLSSGEFSRLLRVHSISPKEVAFQ